jgi:hypothetical protein
VTTPNNKENPTNHCPHCNAELSAWQNPEGTSWGDGIQYVCFNDECQYFIKGWAWMLEKYQQTISYRFRFDPQNGDTGPLPVWSKQALKDRIINR